MSVVKVVPNVVQGVGIRLVDKINTGKKYCLSSKVWGKGEAANVYSCTDNPEYQLVATMNPTLGGESVIASIAVRNMEPEDPNYGQFINNGSVYFKAQGSDIWVSREAGEFENFPKNLDIVEISNNRFDIYLISEIPDGGI